jgi:hypothetical protein
MFNSQYFVVQLLQKKRYYLWFRNIGALGELHLLPARSICGDAVDGAVAFLA